MSCLVLSYTRHWLGERPPLGREAALLAGCPPPTTRHFFVSFLFRRTATDPWISGFMWALGSPLLWSLSRAMPLDFRHCLYSTCGEEVCGRRCTLGTCVRDARAPTVGARELVRRSPLPFRHGCLPPHNPRGHHRDKRQAKSTQWSGSLILVIAISASFGFEAQPRRAFTKDSQLAQGRSCKLRP